VRGQGRMMVLAALALGWAGGVQAKSIELKSTWSGTPVEVSGTGEGWAANFVPVGDPPILVSVENDAQYLYVTLRTSDPKVKSEIAFGGLTVWAEAPKATSGGMGVHFPLHVRGQGGGGQHGSRESGSEDSGSSKGPPLGTINDYSTEFALLGPTREDTLTVGREPGEPVQVAIGDDSGVLVYQVRLPLQATDDHPVAVGAAPGTPVNVTLDTSRPKRQARAEGAEGEGSEGENPEGGPPPDGGMGPGGYGGGYGGSGRGPGGYPGGGMEGMPHGSYSGQWSHGAGRGGVKTFQVDLTVTLASAPATAKAGP
jgi:hypothetical protein